MSAARKFVITACGIGDNLILYRALLDIRVQRYGLLRVGR